MGSITGFTISLLILAYVKQRKEIKTLQEIVSNYANEEEKERISKSSKLNETLSKEQSIIMGFLIVIFLIIPILVLICTK